MSSNPLSVATSRMTVRRANKGDAARLAELSGTLGYPVSAENMKPRLERLVERTSEIVLVAEQPDGMIAGWVHGSKRELLESGIRCEILGLVVDERCRRQGAGRLLVAAVEAWAREAGIDQIAVRSNVARVESHRFYQQLGYVRTKTQHAYRKQLGPGL